ncbi:hypothetical protein GCM10027400_26220 [Pseudoxanthomonas daejeonensis]
MLATLVGGCAMGGRTKPSQSAYEAFDSSNTYSRSLDHSPAQACEAVRRALLSQGFVVGRAEADVVEARKYFQQEESHEQVEFRAVCMPQMRGDQQTVVFVNAVQDRYALRKSNTNASVGVSALGSLSLPIGSSDDSLVKVASETLQDPNFYKRFFAVLDRFLPEEIERPAKASAAPQAQPTLFPVPMYPQPLPAELSPEAAPAPAPATPPPAAPASTQDAPAVLPVPPPATGG